MANTQNEIVELNSDDNLLWRYVCSFWTCFSISNVISSSIGYSLQLNSDQALRSIAPLLAIISFTCVFYSFPFKKLNYFVLYAHTFITSLLSFVISNSYFSGPFLTCFWVFITIFFGLLTLAAFIPFKEPASLRQTFMALFAVYLISGLFSLLLFCLLYHSAIYLFTIIPMLWVTVTVLGRSFNHKELIHNNYKIPVINFALLAPFWPLEYLYRMTVHNDYRYEY